MTLDAIIQSDRFFIRRSGYRFWVTELDDAGKGPTGPVLAFVEQKRFGDRTDIDIYDDESQHEPPLLRIRSDWILRKRPWISGVELSDGAEIAKIERRFKSLAPSSTWALIDTETSNVVVAQERFFIFSVLRCIWWCLPFLGRWTIFSPAAYDIEVDERPVGTYRRTLSLRPSYIVDLSADKNHVVDRRSAIALAIAVNLLREA